MSTLISSKLVFALVCLSLRTLLSETCFQTIPADDMTTTTTTTTAVTACPSAIPLFLTGIPLPGDQAVQFIPAATAAVGQTITVNCVAGIPSILGTVVFVTYDSGVQAVQNTDAFPFPGAFFEQFYMTCTPSGLWDVTIVQTVGPFAASTIVGPLSGIVSTPRSIWCII